MRTVFNATYLLFSLARSDDPTGLWFGVLKCSSRFARTMSDDDAAKRRPNVFHAPGWCSSVSGDWSSRS